MPQPTAARADVRAHRTQTTSAPKEARMVTRGADGLITNDPRMGREIVDVLTEMTRVERLAVDIALWIGVIPSVEPARTNDLAG